MVVIRSRRRVAVQSLCLLVSVACSGRNPAYREPPVVPGADAEVLPLPDARAPIEAPVLPPAPDAAAPDTAPESIPAPVPDAAPDLAPDATVPPDVPPDLRPDKPPPGEALLVVGDVPLQGSDVQLRESLVKLGFRVTAKDGNATVVGDTSGKMVVVISGSAWSDEVRGRFRDVPVPVVVFDHALFAPMAMTNDTEGTHHGSTDSRRVEILPGRHPLAAGLMGEVTVADTTFMMSWGVPGPQATVVAAVVGQPNRFPIFAYEKGAEMFDNLVAPERRVGSFVRFPDQLRYTAAGLQLFEASVLWAAHYAD